MPQEADAVREQGERIELLLEEIQGLAGPTTWPRVEELVQEMVGLYGGGLERLLHAAVESGAASDVFAAAVRDDDLVSSLLLVHGLHPDPPQDRIERALDSVRPYLGSHAGGVELAAFRDDGVVVLRLEGTCKGCPSSRSTVEQLVQKAVL